MASRFGVGRQSVHRWLARYEAGGLEGLADRSHRPGFCPHQMAPEVEAQLLEWRRRHGVEVGGLPGSGAAEPDRPGGSAAA